MRRYGIFGAIALLLIINAIVFIGISTNRSDTPEAVLNLTERELPISYTSYTNEENTGILLQLNWNEFDYRTDWFDRAKLEAIGFDCSLPVQSPEAELYYSKMLPRKTYAVLEYEGAAWEQWRSDREKALSDLEEKVKRGEESKNDLEKMHVAFQNDLRTRSRLFAVDVGSNPFEVRQRYPDRSRFIITPALVRLHYARPWNVRTEKHDPPRIQGLIVSILVDSINVPREKRALLDPLRSKGRDDYYKYSYSRRISSEPRYSVTVHYGKRHEPWIVDIRPTDAYGAEVRK